MEKYGSKTLEGALVKNIEKYLEEKKNETIKYEDDYKKKLKAAVDYNEATEYKLRILNLRNFYNRNLRDLLNFGIITEEQFDKYDIRLY